MDAPHIEDSTVDHADDVEDVRRVIADTERAFNGNDVELLVEHFARNVTTVSVTGTALQGRTAVLEAAASSSPARCATSEPATTSPRSSSSGPTWRWRARTPRRWTPTVWRCPWATP